MKITEQLWKKASSGKDIMLYSLENAHGAKVKLCNIGAGIVGIEVPDRHGKIRDVVLGYDNPDYYFGDGPCAGKCPGRYANRIAKGRFSLNGKEYVLPINNACNHLHGGENGFQNQVWESRIIENAVEFMYFSENGEAGYPGNLKTVVHYEWGDDNALKITFTAQTDAETVLNLTNHAYFNLDGEGNGNILNHELLLNASHYLPTDDTLIPTGNIEEVAGTPLDFTSPKIIGKDINADFTAIKYGKGFDHCFVVDGGVENRMNDVAELFSPDSGICLKVMSSQPGVQIYTGNWLTGCPEGKNKHIYNDYDGVAIECQHFPDSPNNPDFPTTELKPSEKFEQAIIFAFSVK